MSSLEMCSLTTLQSEFLYRHHLWHLLYCSSNRIVRPYTWAGHIPFARVLIKLLEPRNLVELGTHTGNSFNAFCQEIKNSGIKARCYAIDTWLGDAHTGYYDEKIFIELNQFITDNYIGFANLIRMSFHEAVNHFEDMSIDILHIDGLHTYESVKEDFEMWKPKLSERSVVLFHDTHVFDRNFGVYKLWEELKTEYPTFEFVHSHGLGVLYSGTEGGEPKAIELFRIANENLSAFQDLFERASLINLPKEAILYQQRFIKYPREKIGNTLNTELFLGTGGPYSEDIKMINTIEIVDNAGIVTFDLENLTTVFNCFRFDPGHSRIIIANLTITIIDTSGGLHSIAPIKTSSVMITSQGHSVFTDDPWIEFNTKDHLAKQIEIKFNIVSYHDALASQIKDDATLINDLHLKINTTENEILYYKNELYKYEVEAQKLWDDISKKDSLIFRLQNDFK